MIYGIGVDLVEVERMERAIARSGPRLVERLYTAEERLYCGAKRFAVPQRRSRRRPRWFWSSE